MAVSGHVERGGQVGTERIDDVRGANIAGFEKLADAMLAGSSSWRKGGNPGTGRGAGASHYQAVLRGHVSTV